MSIKRLRLIYISLFILLIALSLLELLWGTKNSSPSELWAYISGQKEDLIIRELRLPRLLTALSAGAGLSVAGLLMQSVFRNPLAGPYVLGVSSGASLGAAFVLMGQQIIFSSISTNQISLLIGSLIGALSVIFMILWVAKYISGLNTLLILGILFSGAASSIINILQYFAQAANIKMYVVWTLGNLGGITLHQSLLLLILIFLALIPAFLSIKRLDALNLGDNEAQHLGVDIKKWRMLILLASGALTAFVTAFAGPIAFIGIIVPHMARMLAKSFMHNKIIPLSILIGCNLLVLSDIISHAPSTLYTIPLNSITSLIGLPVVAWLLIKKSEINF